MARSLGSNLTTQVIGNNLHPVQLVKMAFDSGDLNLSSAYYNLTFNGDVYVGAGHLLQLGDPREVGDLEAVGMSIGLSALSPDILGYAITDTNEFYQNRLIYRYFGALQSDGVTFHDDPIEVFRGRMDVMTISDDGETAEVTMQAENTLADFERAVVRYYTPEDHKLLHPNDTFFDGVAPLQDKKILWGTPRT